MKAASSRKSKGTTFRTASRAAGSETGSLNEHAAATATRSAGLSKSAAKAKAAAPGKTTTKASAAKAAAPKAAAGKTSRSSKTTRSTSKTPAAELFDQAMDDTAAVGVLDERLGLEGQTAEEMESDSIPALDGDLDDEIVVDSDDELTSGLDDLAEDVADDADESLAGSTTSGLAGNGLTSSPRIRLTPSQLIAEHRVNSPLDRLELDQVWRMYRADPNTELRNYLWQRYLPLVRYNAERVYSRLPDEVDLDNLIQAGTFGLMDAIGSFDLDRGVKFETFCAQRIRGAILDELRSMDWVPRLVRHRTSRVEQVRERMRAQHGIRPTSEEIANELGCDEEEVKKVLKDGHAVSMSSLSKQRYQSDGSREVREIDVIHDSRQSDPFMEVQRADLKSMLCKGLSRAERLIVVLYYYEGMTMKEIGMTLDLSESRVSQMHSLILLRLKAQMQHREGEFEGEE